MTAITAFQTAQNLAITASFRVPALMAQTAGLCALGEVVLKGAGQLAYQIPFAKSVENYFTAKFDEKGEVSTDPKAKLSWGGYVVDKLQIPYLFNVARPFKGEAAMHNLKVFAALSAVSMGMLQGAHLLAGKPHPLYNRVLGCGFSLRVVDTPPLEQITALIGKVRSAWGI